MNLTRNLLTWRIWWFPNNASRWQTGFNLAFKGLNQYLFFNIPAHIWSLHEGVFSKYNRIFITDAGFLKYQDLFTT